MLMKSFSNGLWTLAGHELVLSCEKDLGYLLAECLAKKIDSSQKHFPAMLLLCHTKLSENLQLTKLY